MGVKSGTLRQKVKTSGDLKKHLGYIVSRHSVKFPRISFRTLGNFWLQTPVFSLL